MYQIEKKVFMQGGKCTLHAKKKKVNIEMEFPFFSLCLLLFLIEDFCSGSDFTVWNI